MKVTLYSTRCPQCKILGKKLAIKGIDYVEIEDRAVMENLGITAVPMISVDGGALMTFKESIDWLNSLEV